MKSKIKHLLLSVFSLALLANCAVAPFSDPITPQTLGKGNQSHSITAGYPYIGYVFSMGISETFDAGLQLESQIGGLDLGVRLMLQATDYEETEWSGSLLTGAGLTTEGSYVYGGMVWGRRFGFYELTFVPRFNYVNISGDIDAEVTTDVQDIYSITFDSSGDYFYSTLSISNTFWFRPTFGFSLTIGGAYLLPWGDSSDDGFIAPYGGIGLIFK